MEGQRIHVAAGMNFMKLYEWKKPWRVKLELKRWWKRINDWYYVSRKDLCNRWRYLTGWETYAIKQWKIAVSKSPGQPTEETGKWVSELEDYELWMQFYETS